MISSDVLNLFEIIEVIGCDVKGAVGCECAMN